MSQTNENYFESLPVGRLGIIPLESCMTLGRKVDSYLATWRREREHSRKGQSALDGYERDTYIIPSRVPRFGSGEAKGFIHESVRGDDIYILVDVCNYSMTYSSLRTCKPYVS